MATISITLRWKSDFRRMICLQGWHSSMIQNLQDWEKLSESFFRSVIEAVGQKNLHITSEIAYCDKGIEGYYFEFRTT